VRDVFADGMCVCSGERRHNHATFENLAALVVGLLAHVVKVRRVFFCLLADIVLTVGVLHALAGW
jgi:hypothetical protein